MSCELAIFARPAGLRGEVRAIRLVLGKGRFDGSSYLGTQVGYRDFVGNLGDQRGDFGV